VATHRLEASPQTTVNVFDPGHRPALTVQPGDTVVVSSLDASGFLERLTRPGDRRATMFPGDFRGHCLTGPIEVRGARPGDMLAITLEDLRPGGWGWTVSPAVPGSPVAQRLGLAGTGGDGAPVSLLWELDAGAGTGTATSDAGTARYTRPLAPFLGVIGVAPAGPGGHSTIPPRAGSGGNIDCKELVAGTTLYLPVSVPGALLYLGDGHGAQGDGESCGTAIECPMTTRATIGLAQRPALASVHAQAPAGKLTFGFSPDLNEAMGDALDAMVTWLAALYGTSRAEALAVASIAVDLRVTQVANGTWGVHALLPDGVLTVSR
jgi:acetamidase/formamidase